MATTGGMISGHGQRAKAQQEGSCLSGRGATGVEGVTSQIQGKREEEPSPKVAGVRAPSLFSHIESAGRGPKLPRRGVVRVPVLQEGLGEQEARTAMRGRRRRGPWVVGPPGGEGERARRKKKRERQNPKCCGGADIDFLFIFAYSCGEQYIFLT